MHSGWRGMIWFWSGTVLYSLAYWTLSHSSFYVAAAIVPFLMAMKGYRMILNYAYHRSD